MTTAVGVPLPQPLTSDTKPELGRCPYSCCNNKRRRVHRNSRGIFDLAWNPTTGETGNQATNRLTTEGIEVLAAAIDAEFGAVTQVGVIEDRFDYDCLHQLKTQIVLVEINTSEIEVIGNLALFIRERAEAEDLFPDEPIDEFGIICITSIAPPFYIERECVCLVSSQLLKSISGTTDEIIDQLSKGRKRYAIQRKSSQIFEYGVLIKIEGAIEHAKCMRD